MTFYTLHNLNKEIKCAARFGLCQTQPDMLLSETNYLFELILFLEKL